MRVKIFIFHKWRRQSTFICLILVLQWIKREITIIINILHAWKGGWCWRSPKEVHWPRAHFSVMHSSKWGKTHFKKQLLRSIFPFVKKQPPLVLLQPTWAEVMDIAKRRAKNGSWRALRFLLWSPQVFITPRLLVWSQELTLFKTDASTSQETPPSSYVQEKRAATHSFPHYDLPLNSFTPADHHAANEWTPIKRQNGRKKTKKGNLGRKTLLVSHPPLKEEEEKTVK